MYLFVCVHQQGALLPWWCADRPPSFCHLITFGYTPKPKWVCPPPLWAQMLQPPPSQWSLTGARGQNHAGLPAGGERARGGSIRLPPRGGEGEAVHERGQAGWENRNRDRWGGGTSGAVQNGNQSPVGLQGLLWLGPPTSELLAVHRPIRPLRSSNHTSGAIPRSKIRSLETIPLDFLTSKLSLSSVFSPNMFLQAAVSPWWIALFWWLCYNYIWLFLFSSLLLLLKAPCAPSGCCKVLYNKSRI